MSIEDGVYFENLENITKEFILSAVSNVEIAVAWINFKIYFGCFKQLLNNGVRLSIIINDDYINSRYDEQIHELNILGACIKKFKVQGVMHQKFIIVDNIKVLSGSFNLSKNANMFNIENIIINNNPKLVLKYSDHFKFLLDIDCNDIKLLRNPVICDYCNQEIFYLCIISQDGDYHTKFEYYQVCGCYNNLKFLNSEFYDVSVYNNFIALCDEYNDIIDSFSELGEEPTEYELKKLDFEHKMKINRYFSETRNYKNGLPVIHAVGMKGWRNFPYPYKDDGEWFINILWKEYYTQGYIDDEYEL